MVRAIFRVLGDVVGLASLLAAVWVLWLMADVFLHSGVTP